MMDFTYNFGQSLLFMKKQANYSKNRKILGVSCWVTFFSKMLNIFSFTLCENEKCIGKCIEKCVYRQCFDFPGKVKIENGFSHAPQSQFFSSAGESDHQESNE